MPEFEGLLIQSKGSVCELNCRVVGGGCGWGGEYMGCRLEGWPVTVCRMSGTDSLCWTALSKSIGAEILLGERHPPLPQDSEINKDHDIHRKSLNKIHEINWICMDVMGIIIKSFILISKIEDEKKNSP